MIFKKFEPTDIVEGKVTKVSSGFWPNGNTYWSSSYFEHNFWDLSTTQTPSTAYGTSIYDVRKTMYYADVYPDLTYKNSYKDPYFSVAYGHYRGSGSFSYEETNIKAYPTKAIYTQYKNLLLGSADPDGKFTMKSGSTEVNADDIFVMDFSSYKMKDRIDEGVFEMSLQGESAGKIITLIDDSHYVSGVQSVYQLITGSLANLPTTRPDYNGIGLLYPAEGIVVFNAYKLVELLGSDNLLSVANTSIRQVTNSNLETIGEAPSASYFSGSKSTSVTTFPSQYKGTSVRVCLNSTDGTGLYNSNLNPDYGNQNNILAFLWMLRHSKKNMCVRKSEYIPSKHYFVRVKNRDFNYSNNPTFVYDGTEYKSTGEKPAAGTIRNEDFYTDPKTYITTIGLYNDTNELVAVAKLSRPAVKSFENEILCKVRLDF